MVNFGQKSGDATGLYLFGRSQFGNTNDDIKAEMWLIK